MVRFLAEEHVRPRCSKTRQLWGDIKMEPRIRDPESRETRMRLKLSMPEARDWAAKAQTSGESPPEAPCMTIGVSRKERESTGTNRIYHAPEGTRVLDSSRMPATSINRLVRCYGVRSCQEEYVMLLSWWQSASRTFCFSVHRSIEGCVSLKEKSGGALVCVIPVFESKSMFQAWLAIGFSRFCFSLHLRVFQRTSNSPNDCIVLYTITSFLKLAFPQWPT